MRSELRKSWPASQNLGDCGSTGDLRHPDGSGRYAIFPVERTSVIAMVTLLTPMALQ